MSLLIVPLIITIIVLWVAVSEEVIGLGLAILISPIIYIVLLIIYGSKMYEYDATSLSRAKDQEDYLRRRELQELKKQNENHNRK